MAEAWENTEKELQKIKGSQTETVIDFKSLPFVGEDASILEYYTLEIGI